VKLGVFLVLFSDRDFCKALDTAKEAGCEAVEIGAGNYPGDAHCKPAELLADDAKAKKFKAEVEKRGLEISALSCHGNPLHPDPAVAKAHADVQRQTILLAAKLGVPRIVTFSGCPGDGEGAKHPNWVTCPWPDDFSKVLKWQWDEKAIPYWSAEAAFARKNGVKEICLEMHPGFIVYNPESLLKLRAAAGEEIGANFDPSHLFWQGIDPVAALRAIGKAVFHVHAKDTQDLPRRAEPLVDLPVRRVRPRRRFLEGLRFDAPDDRL